MTQDDQALDFSTVIASTVHDMKNSLAMLMQAHSQWLARLPEAQRKVPEQGVIDFEFAHLNGMLVQPMMRIARNMMDLSRHPEDASRIIVPSPRRDEIGAVSGRPKRPMVAHRSSAMAINP